MDLMPFAREGGQLRHGMTVKQIDPSLSIGYLGHGQCWIQIHAQSLCDKHRSYITKLNLDQTTQKKEKKETTLTGIAVQHQDNLSLSMPMFDIPSQLK